MGLKKNPNIMLKKIFIKTFGCQMNEYDSNRIFDTVKKIGFEKTEKYEDANCYLLNTCHIRIGRASCRKECRSRWSPYH